MRHTTCRKDKVFILKTPTPTSSAPTETWTEADLDVGLLLLAMWPIVCAAIMW